MFLDALLHHIWIHRKSSSSLKKFEELLEIIKLTPRVWNSKTNFKQTLRYITSILNININIIGLKVTRFSFWKCDHTYCHLPFYIFQNTLVKIIRESSCFLPVHVVYFQGKYYVLLEDIRPFLINNHHQNPVIFENIQITNTDIIKILKNDYCTIPFNINLYTSYSYIRDNAIKTLQSNIVAKYVKNDSTKILHLFIAPYLEDNFDLHVLTKIFDDTKGFENYNLFADINFTEGNTHYDKKSKKENILNQEYCICDHPDTERIFLSKKSSSKHLGNGI